MKKIEMVKQVLENYVHYQSSINLCRENNRRDDTDLSAMTAIMVLADNFGWKITPMGVEIGAKFFFTGAVIKAEGKCFGLWALRYSSDDLYDFKDIFKTRALNHYPDVVFLYDDNGQAVNAE
jgi:hypothetical protein